MRFIPHWRRKLLRAYSSYAHYLTIFLMWIQQVFPVVADYLPREWMIGALILFLIATSIEQPELCK